MPKINKEKLKELIALAKQNKAEQQIRKFFNLPDYNLNRDEVTKIVKQMKEFLVTLKSKNQTEFKNLNQSITDLSEKLKGDNTENLLA